MKRFYSLVLLAISVIASASAQSKFDAGADEYLAHAKVNRTAARVKAAGSKEVKTLAPSIKAEDKVSVLVTMRSAGMESVLAENGFDVENVLGRVVIARLTADEMEQVAAFDEVMQVALGYEAETKLRVARQLTGVDDIHEAKAASGLSHAYTGEGVILGMMDTGLDANHLNFRDSNGNLRVKNIWEIKGGEGVYTLYNTPEAIAAYDTDNDSETHATHVLGIMGGSYDQKPGSGNGSVATMNSRNQPSISGSNANPYYGVAKDAELSVAIGSLQNNNTVIAASAFRDYVKSTGRPGVMNLSLGNNRGPHDGTDAGSLALAEAGKDVLVCISAGNEGGDNISASKTLSSSDNQLKTFISPGTSATGYIDIWSSNSQTLKVSLAAVNKTTGEIKWRYDITQPCGTTWIGGPDLNYSNVTKSTQFGQYFGNSGLMSYSGNVNALNNRYDVYMTFEMNGGSDSSVAAAIIVESSAGTTIDVTGSISLQSNGLAGYLAGSPAKSINGMACGDNVLVVGAYVNSNPFMTLGGQQQYGGTSYAQGNIAYFSSYGKTFSGRQLPDVVGPGMFVVSSFNSYYIKKIVDNAVQKGLSSPTNTKTEEQLRNEAEAAYSAWVYNPAQPNPDNSKEYLRNYWGEMSGTSMSSPFVAGVLALWAQASEEMGERLTMTRVKEVIKQTADHDEYTAAAPERWGMGKINALAGLKYILATTGVGAVGADDAENSLIIEPVGNKSYNVFLAGNDGFTATLYNLQGAAVAKASTTGTELTIDGSALGSGVYVLSVEARNTRVSRKITL